jgi:DNA (cytosine-5)-methyltransferase 1
VVSGRHVISLYTGAGGLDYGLEAAGFETAVALDFDHDACETLRRSRPRWQVIESDVFDVTTRDLLARAGLRRRQPALVVGGPPCQPFSKSGYWVRGDAARLGDPRATTIEGFLRVVREALPRVILFENVQGVAFTRKDEGLALLRRGLERINRQERVRYRPHFRVVNAADFGVPQLRDRFFLVAARDGSDFRFPTPTHMAPKDQQVPFCGMRTELHRTAWDALAEIRPEPEEDLAVRGRWAALLPTIPEGHNYLWHTDRGSGAPLFGWRRHYWNFLLKLAKHRPSWTIQAQPGPAVGPFHWENRRLGVRELCALQTFPQNVTIYGERTSAQRQIGNAVPSLLTEVLGRAIREQLLREPRPGGNLRLLPPDRSPAPPAEKIAPVPAEFLSRVGGHEAHPGTGKGYRARAWALEREGDGGAQPALLDGD